MISKSQKPATPWLLVVLFIIIAASSILFGILYYRSQKSRLLNDKEQELSAMADLKVRQIAQWRNERTIDGILISGNIPFAKYLYDCISENGIKIKPKNRNIDLKFLTVNSEYRNIILIDTLGNTRAFYPDPDTLMAAKLKKKLPELKSSCKTRFTEINETDKISALRIDLIVPLIDTWEGDSTVFGFIAMHIDPNKALLPIIQTLPIKSKTAESLLVSRSGDEVIYLNKLRFRKNSDEVLRKSLNDTKIAAVMALHGIERTTDAIDYRGASVVAAMKKVPGSSWYLVAKTDKNEVFIPLNRQIVLIIIIIILFIATIGLLLGFAEWNENARFYRDKYESEVDHLALRKHYDHILKYANDIIFLTDRNHNIIEANDRACEAYQLSREDLTGLNINKIYASFTIGELDNVKKILEDVGHTTFETVHTRKDGSTFPLEISARSVNIEGVKYFQSICRDITERKSAEKILRESEEKFRKIFEESPFSMAMTGKDLKIIRANEAFCRMLGYREEEIRSNTFRMFTHPDYIGTNEIEITRLLNEEIPVYHTEKQYVKKDHSAIWGSATISAIRNNSGEILYLLAMVEDITLRKKAEAEIIAARDKAEESDRLKTAFLHNISHEIRTPMNAIIGFSALLNEPDITESERQQYIDIIFRSGSQLLTIINDIVDIANIESGLVKINIKELNINSMMRSLNEQFSYREKHDLITIRLKTGLPDESSVIMTDSTKLIQILSNLISNATKFTKEGEIEFGYDLKDGMIEFYVRDTGIGIPEELHGKIFERFFQADSQISRKFGGTGLGLSICKAYVELLGGKIWVHSNPGEGSDFRFTIPYREPSEK